LSHGTLAIIFSLDMSDVEGLLGFEKAFW